jgi:hypothetical protein
LKLGKQRCIVGIGLEVKPLRWLAKTRRSLESPWSEAEQENDDDDEQVDSTGAGESAHGQARGVRERRCRKDRT